MSFTAWVAREDRFPLSARAASASVPSDALTAANPRSDQRNAAHNCIAMP